MKKKLFDLTYKFRVYVLIILVIIVSVSVFFSFSLKNEVNELILQKQESERPAEIIITRITTPDCVQCQRIIETVEDSIRQQLNIKFIDQKSILSDSNEAKNLIKQFQIENVPAIILEGEIEKDAQINQALVSFGYKKGNSIVISGTSPPYKKTSTDEIVGEFTVIYLTDEDCQKCYDVEINKNILASFGMFPFEETSIDRKEVRGIQLINRYDITKVPTVIVQGDLELYSRFQSVWEEVGTVYKSDNTYILEAVEQLGVYRDLSQNKIIELQQENQQVVHNHPNFLVFIEGKQFDFSENSNRYFVKDQRAHLEVSTIEGAAGKVIHVHTNNISMQSFVETLGWKLSNTCLITDQGESFCNKGEKTLKVFLNGIEDLSFGGLEVQDFDKYLITFGDESDAEIQQQIEQVPDFAF